MEGLERKNRAIDQVRLLADFSKGKGIREYTPDALQAFADETSRELASIVAQETRLTGIRSEAMFLAVVAGIGKVRLIKSEDEGDVYYQGAAVQSPDFRVVLPDGRGLLVEVKAVRMKDIQAKVKLSDRYVQQLRRYADLMKTREHDSHELEQSGARPRLDGAVHPRRLREARPSARTHRTPLEPRA
jgi:hypothetical protein